MDTRRDDVAAAAAAVSFALLAGLVAAGVCTTLDRYAVRHLMPWAEPTSHGWIDVRSWFLPPSRPTPGGTLVDLWTFPASPLVSALAVAACAWVLVRRGLRRAALAVCLLWVAANAIEVVCKLALERPPVGFPGLRHSYPSGHTVRAFVVAAVVGWTWRRAGPAAVAWAVAVPVALVLVGAHVPTDVAGGILLSACLIALWRRSVVAPYGLRDSHDPPAKALRQAGPKRPAKEHS
jgi:undecaprenyl-diphosphatase